MTALPEQALLAAAARPNLPKLAARLRAADDAAAVPRAAPAYA